MSTTWRTHYRNWTLSDLIISNLLRPQPLPWPDLHDYAGHKLSSILTHVTALKSQGRISRMGDVIREHPRNQRMTTGVPFAPLPDPGSPPLTPSFVEGRATAHRIAQEAAPPPTPGSTPSTLDRAGAARILEKWITEGSAGKDTPRFIATWLDLVGQSHGSGPPPPTTPRAMHDRLLTCMLACTPATVRAAISTWELRHAEQPLDPNPAVPGSLHLVDSDSALGAGPSSPPGEGPPPPGPGLPLEDSLR